MRADIRYLYGGAISCMIPHHYEDLSNVLPLPDHQEVFVRHINRTEGSTRSTTSCESDCVLSFEILDYVEDREDRDIARATLTYRYLFDDLVACNEATYSSMHTWNVSDLSKSLGVANHKAIFVTGSMNVAKGHRQYKEKERPISALLYVLRLPDYRSDILVTYNFPLDENSIDYKNELTLFEEIVSSLVILDTNLFLHNHV
ncbi:hypothetical protein X943_003286 [Babesia divergens]|uniref:Ran guanine nucleotide release factor n=1 Tax=Babesia divergens TaxID=32595 RepID=A0AAD9LHH1_BABDI|nr:hypothetical protein X943_003286 [Babesia divergens]